jgi:hypothetical protein
MFSTDRPPSSDEKPSSIEKSNSFPPSPSPTLILPQKRNVSPFDDRVTFREYTAKPEQENLKYLHPELLAHYSLGHPPIFPLQGPFFSMDQYHHQLITSFFNRFPPRHAIQMPTATDERLMSS